MLPPDVTSVASWISLDGVACYRLMEAAAEDALVPWVRAWDDLVEFQVVPVRPSAEFWESWEALGTKAPS